MAVVPATQQTVVVDTANSAHAVHRALPVDAVVLDDPVLAPRMRINRVTTLPAQFQHLEETGRLNNFRRVAGLFDGSFEGIYFNDSDVYKWLEAASWALAAGDDPDLNEMIDNVITLIEGAQYEDGYVNTYFSLEREGERWSNLRDLHELYCAGHLIQAAVAHHRATGTTRLLAVATRFADLIADTFGPASEGKREETDGHEEIELALIELARTTGNQRYLDQARFFIDLRGQGTVGGSPYHQDATPLREQDTMVGHAVRAVYLNAGAADLVAETSDAHLRDALDRMWTSMTTRRMYVSGGIGARWEGEAFGGDYELPNARAYTETCAAIGAIMWSWRMLLLSDADDTRYADLIEWTLYNAVLPGLSLDGGAYFYQNPLADNGAHRRQPWFGCACCPPNVARLLASLPGYLATVTSARAGESDSTHDTVWLHLFAAGSTTVQLPSGGSVRLRQTTTYPWDGVVTITVDAVEDAGAFTLNVRIPAWAEDATGDLNGDPLPPGEAAPGQYAAISRVWQPGDTVHLTLPMPPRRLVSHPAVEENTARVALARGPLLFCVEGADNAANVPDLFLPDAAEITADERPDLLGGTVVLSAEATVDPPAPGWSGRLYRPLAEVEPPDPRPVQLTAIPYHLWANRDPSPMRVWLRRG